MFSGLWFFHSWEDRLTRYWLKGEKAGTFETFAALPGFPDNVRTNENGEFWVALHCRRSLYGYVMGIFPRLRKLILKLPIQPKFHYLFQIGGRPHGLIIKYSPDGKILKVLEDKEGKVVRAVSEVEEKDGKLWIGSVLMPFIAVYWSVTWVCEIRVVWKLFFPEARVVFVWILWLCTSYDVEVMVHWF